MASIALRGLEFYGWHGVPDAEQTTGHRYSVDAVLEVSPAAWPSDDISQTIDYATLGNLLVRIGSEQRCRTIEKLAHEMVSAMLSAFPTAIEAEITVRKLLPPGGLIVACAEAALRQQR